MASQHVDAATVKFDFKTIILILGAAWTPAIAIGGGLLKWGFSMDHRVTVQEAGNQNLTVVLSKLDATLNSDIKEIKHDVRALQLELATMKATNK